MRRIMIDAHVHLNPCGPTAQALIDAHRRMTASAGKHPLSVFMLAEQAGLTAFSGLRTHGIATEESESLWLSDKAGDILVLAGRQVVSAERVEILALATAACFPDGQPAEQLVDAMIDAGALVILPWGVGKWIGQRGRVIDHLLQRDERRQILLGDISARPRFWRERRLRARPVLRGSDPLPIKGDSRRIGTFGTALDGMLSHHRPAADLRALMRSDMANARSFGKPVSAYHLLRDQIRLRLGQ